VTEADTMCVRAFAHVSAARGWQLPLLSSSLWGKRAVGSNRVALKLGESHPTL
jgi:hypothetical protein